jgi:hypothetical protein
MNMPTSFPRSTMRIAYLALFLTFIFSLTMVSMQGPIQSYNRGLRVVRERALRVGMGYDVKHVLLEGNLLAIYHLQTLHGEGPNLDQHVSGWCHPIRNLLRRRATQSGATVPRPVFTTPHRKFYGTLAPTRH